MLGENYKYFLIFQLSYTSLYRNSLIRNKYQSLNPVESFEINMMNKSSDLGHIKDMNS